MTGFEPAAFCTQNKRATKLRYIPCLLTLRDYYTRLSPSPPSYSTHSSFACKEGKEAMRNFFGTVAAKIASSAVNTTRCGVYHVQIRRT